MIPFPKIKLEWIKDLNIKTKTIKLIVENVGRNLHDLQLGNVFLDTTLKS